MGANVEAATAPPAKQDPEALVLRGRPRPVIRFRKSVIVGGAGLLAASVAGLAWVALDPPAFRSAVAREELRAASTAPADALPGAPRDYADVPKLGPPLPGDLGRPILERQRQLAGEGAGDLIDAADPEARRVAAERQRLQAEEAAARASAVLVQRPSAPAEALVTPATSAGAPVQAGEASIDRGPPPDAGLRLAAGSIIPASLITGLNSDHPGMVIAQVTENVRDSATGTRILIPQGARLIGTYDAASGYGQSRVLLVWTRLLFPDGSSLGLAKVPAADVSGYAGLEDQVDGHGWQVLKGVVLSSLLGVGSELGIGGGHGIVGAVREALQQNGGRAGEQVVARGLDVKPTLTVRPGWPVRVLVREDLDLKPWSPQ